MGQIAELSIKCAKIAESKGFNCKRTPEQMLLISSEISEALENIKLLEENNILNQTIEKFQTLMKDFEEIRKEISFENIEFIEKTDSNLLEEIADAVIRCFSYCGANNLDLESAILKKIAINSKRDYLHGKKF
ncbi:MAG: hypothetical protein ABIJ17_02605 [Patescibacteria group bacterium]